MVVVTFRFDVSHSHANRNILRAWLRGFSKCMLAEEHGEETNKTHYQGLLFTDKNVETIRRHRPFAELTGSQYSIALVRKLEEYESYLTKENLIYSRGYTDDALKAIPKWIKQSKVKKKTSFLENIVADFKIKYPNFKMDDLDIEIYTRFVDKSIKRYFKCPSKKICEDLTRGLLVQVSPKFRKLLYKDLFTDIILWAREEMENLTKKENLTKNLKSPLVEEV